MKQKNILLFALLLFAGTLSAQPTIWGGAKLKLDQGDTTFISNLGAVKSWLGLSGGGTVSSFSSGALSPIFTTSVANPNTTPSLAFALSNAAANTYLGNATGSAAGPSYTAAGALTKVDDTNVTLTLGGNASTSLLRAASITVGWSGLLDGTRGGTSNGFTAFTGPAASLKTFTLPNASSIILTSNAAVTAAQGGTGQTTYTIGDLLQATGATVLSRLAAVATGNTLLSGGVGVASSWGKVGLTTHVSGTLPVANGGTNLTSVGADVTLLGSNGSANIYYGIAFTNISAAVGASRASSTLNINIPDADASFRGLVSTGTQTMAGAKTFSGAVTTQGLSTASAGLVAVSSSTVAALYLDGVGRNAARSTTATTTLDENDNILRVGTLTADITINLPDCNSTRNEWIYRVVKEGSDAFAFILDPSAAQTFFDNAATKTYFGQGNTVTCQCQSGSTSWTILR